MKHLEQAFGSDNKWWKYILLFIIVFIAMNFIGAIPIGIVVAIKALKTGDVSMPNPDNYADFSAFGIDPNFGFALMLSPYIIGLVLFWLIIKPMHKRKMLQVVTGASHFRWNRVFFSAFIWTLAIGIYILAIYLSNPDNFTVTINVYTLVPLFLISIFLIPLQAGFEEVLMRGYIAQGIGVLTRSRWMVLIIPALIFALLHSFNPEVKAYGFWIAMPQYLIFGLVFGLVSILDDGIETAIGAHAANNVILSIFLTSSASAFQTPSLLIQHRVNPVTDLLFLSVISLVFVFALKAKYKWNWTVLNKRVEATAVKN